MGRKTLKKFGMIKLVDVFFKRKMGADMKNACDISHILNSKTFGFFPPFLSLQN